MLTFDVICSFRVGKQIGLNIRVDDIITEEEFITYVFNNLTLTEVKRLDKISCCQLFTAHEDDVLPFMRKTSGKYYFNTDINKDEETASWDHFKNIYIVRKSSRQRAARRMWLRNRVFPCFTDGYMAAD
jgi:hypothetical protein